jgi:hypothetical protein
LTGSRPRPAGRRAGSPFSGRAAPCRAARRTGRVDSARAGI